MDEQSDARDLPRRESGRAHRVRGLDNALTRIFSGLSVRKPDSESAEDTLGPHGLTMLFDSPEPLAEIIFVHGLGGGSRKTWDKGRDPSLYWPKEWLSRDPEFKHVRVHTFGYPASWSEREESIFNISMFARQLLEALQSSATIRRAKSTSLIFVCHSMGGLVVKRAFILAKIDYNFQDLAKRVDTIYFLATPHRGADYAGLLSTLIRATSGAKPFIADLERNSPMIRDINDEFRQFSDEINIHSFFETKRSSISGLGERFIVDQASAITQLRNERVTPIEADHFGICKYPDPRDANYLIVRSAIIEALDRITETWRTNNEHDIRNQKQSVRKFLKLSDHLRQISVDFDEPKASGSCEWLTREPAFRRWCDAQEPRIFCLTGHPGTGKSFIARHVINHITSLGFNCSYFFFAAGDKGHSSITGCLLSLAWQMAETNAFIRGAFLELLESEMIFNSDNHHSIWRTLFVGGVLKTDLVKPHFWVLDGLDECTNSAELLQLLSKIKSTFPLQIYLSSQPTPEIEAHIRPLGTGAHIHEVAREVTAQDIKCYVESYRYFVSVRESSGREDLMSSIVRKSKGSFIWVKLVMQELQGVYSIEAAWEVLKSQPSGMDQVYLKSLNRLAQNEPNKPVTKSILMWASTSLRPLTIDEMKPALKLHIDQTLDRLEEQVGWLTGYLVTFNPNKLNVKMVHDTARRFTLDPGRGSPFPFTEKEAHEALAIVCLKQLISKELRAPTRGRRSTTTQVTDAPAPSRPPFFNYACLAFHEHIDRSGTSCKEVLDLLGVFFGSTNGNVLTWIDHLVSQNNGLAAMTRAGLFLKSFATRIRRSPLRHNKELELVQSWSTDIMRIVTKFGRNLVRYPSAIYNMLPPFCPRNSAMFRQFGRSPRGITVVGVPSMTDWEDCLATIVYKQRGNRAISVAATSSYFATGMRNSFLRLYHTSTCQEFSAIHHGEPVKVIEFSIDGQFVATAGDRHLCLWDISTSELVWESKLSQRCISLTFNPDEEEVVVACADNRLRYFDAHNGSPQGENSWYMDEDQQKEIGMMPVAAAMSSELKLLAFVYRGRHIALWNWEEDIFVGFCKKPGADARTCPFHASSMVFNPAPKASLLAASYEQGEILIFDPTTIELKARYKTSTDNQKLSCSPDGKTLLAGDSNGTIRIFDFQSVSSDNQQLRLLHVISGASENIGALAFCDDKRFIDTRGSKVKVWEPAVLLQQDLSDADSIASESNISIEPSSRETSLVTSMTLHPSGSHVFFAMQDGSIKIFEEATGKLTQVLQEHAPGDNVVRMMFSKDGSVLASAGISSRILIHTVTKLQGGQQWVLERKVFEHRMGEAIEQLLFNNSCTRLLVVTTVCDMVYSLEDGKTSTAKWDTRLPGVWCNDPRDDTQLMLWVNQKLRIYTWEGLREVSAPGGLELDFELPVGFGVQSVWSGWHEHLIATVYTENSRARSKIRLLIWDADDFDSSPDDSGMDMEMPISPHASYQVYGKKVAELVGGTGIIISLSGLRVLFLDDEGWLCSIVLDDTRPELYHRHFFVPGDWIGTNDAPLVTSTDQGHILFAREDELGVIKRGLDFSFKVPLPARSRRSSSGT